MTNSMLPAEGVSASAAASAFFRWEVPEKPFSVNFSLEVMDRLEREVIESFKAVTKRGSEIGGILLGRAARGARRIITVEDYRSVECDYSRGPLFLLSDADKARLDETITSATRPSAGLAVVGFFRSNTRRDLVLDDEDLALIQEYFASPDNAFLLVKPFAMKPSVAGFFFWEDGRIHREATYLQFPFRRSELVKGWAQAITAAAGPAAPERPVPVAVPKREERVPVAAPPERPAPAPISIKREEPPVKPETPAAAPAPPPPQPQVVERPAPPPVEAQIPPAPPVEKRDSFVPPTVTKHEEAPPPPLPARREERPAATPLVFKREEKPPITVVPKREEPAAHREERPVAAPAPPKREERPVVAAAPPKREERPAPAVTLRERPGVTPRSEPQPVAKKEEKPVLVKETPAPPKKEEAPAVALAPVKVEPPPAPVPAVKTVQPVEALSAPAAPGLVRRLTTNRWLWLTLVVLLVGAGAAVKFLGIGSTPENKPVETSLGLRVERNAGQFVLTWNRHTELIQQAQRATLTINDGDHKEDVDLDLGQLRSGSIFYSPMTSDVSFRLEVTDLKRGKSQSESVRWLAGRPSPSVPMTQGQQVVVPVLPAPAEKPLAEGPMTAPPKPLEAPQAATQTAGAQPPAPTPPPAQAAMAETSSPPTEPPKPAQVTAAAPKPFSLAARLSAPPQLSEPPSLGSGRGVMTAPIPVGAVRPPAAPPPPKEAPKPPPPKVGGMVVEAKLIPGSRVIPAYPPLARQARVSGSVKVQATIGADGRVVKAVAISGPPLLRQTAVDAVMRWRYEPSRLNGQPVESTTEVDVGFNLGAR